MNILITSAGRRVSLVRAFQTELKKLNEDAMVMAVDAKPSLSAACFAADKAFEVPRLDHPDYIDILISICKENKISLVIPTIDTELLLLARNKKHFDENGITPLLPTLDFIEKCRDKRVIHEFFKTHNIEVAHEYSKDQYKLPLFIKPIDGSRSVDTYIIKEKEDLTDYHFKNDKLMFLEYLDHSKFEEFTCDLYYAKDHKLKCIVPRKRIEVRDGEVNKGVTVKNKIVDYVREHLSFIDGAIGCLTVQFFKHKEEDRIVGIEINPRFGGGYPLSYRAGANFPGWIIEEYFMNREIEDQFDCWEENLLMLRYDDEILVHDYKG
ncbi:ATP-grasp domain-containing protein [Leptobacterium flavescens]|uniref:ATP-grasp domain-containing protein n=1 Tax=Leptobacterium flavescens TaxID=472055 RepID=A0A6P0UPT8_9FLAO|nr:ATP-grasp domain-containing protein [Leptobacterium flavescens]NER13988.1 ATP-grasp domain-containing protein [Leptobacterium flavescens]